MPRLPAVAVRQYRRTLSLFALAASLAAAASCADAPTAAPTIPSLPAIRHEETAALDTTIYIPTALDTARRDYCNGYPYALPVEQTGPAACALLLDARWNDPLSTYLSSVEEFYTFVARCVPFDTTGRMITTTSRRRWSAGIPGRLRIVPNAADGGESATITPLDTGVYQINCEVSNAEWDAEPAYGHAQISVGFARTQLVGATVTPDTLRGELGEPLRFVFHPVDQYGRLDRVDMSRYWIGYAVGNGSVAWVQSDGAVFAQAPGITTVQAVVNTENGEVRSNVATLEIMPSLAAVIYPSETSLLLFKGESRALWTRIVNRFGADLYDKPVTWTSLNPGIATVTADGLIYAKASGIATIKVQSDTAVATVSVTVATPKVTTIVVTPNAYTLNAGATKQLSAAAYDQRGALMPNVVFTWRSSNEYVATVSAGLVTAVKKGSATIKAVASGVTGTAAITVVVPPPPPTAPVCGDPAGCLPVQAAYVSHFTNDDCTGTEYYYTEYFSRDGVRRSWNGSGLAAVTTGQVTVRSYKLSDGGGDGTGCRRNVWGAAGYSFGGMARIYR